MTTDNSKAPAKAGLSLQGLPPTHPGEILRDIVLPSLGRSKTEIAQLLGVSRQTLYDLLDGKQAVTAVMALRLGKLCGNGPELWQNMQAAYDLRLAREALGDDLDRIPTLQAAA